MNRTGCILLFATLVSSAWARLGETEAELIARFGQPTFRDKHSTYVQGKVWELGPRLSFKQDDWSIVSEMVDGRAATESYTKVGEWTDAQILAVLAANAQGATWTLTSKPGSSAYLREWKRTDGATARWTGRSISLVAPAYARAKEIAEAKAKAETRRMPKI